MNFQRRLRLDRPFFAVALWLLVLVAACAALAAGQYRVLVGELEQQSTILHRLVSQRADQHDAHMTALSALAVAADSTRPDLFLEVASTISRFYSRIDEVQLVPFERQREVVGSKTMSAAVADIIRDKALASDGRIELVAHPEHPHHYLMIKRSPNSAQARNGLALDIDARMLVGDAGPLWTQAGTALTLSLPDGTRLVGRPITQEALRFSRILGSASQPLLLETGMEIGILDLLPPSRTGLILASTSLLYVVAMAALRQRRRTRTAIEQARVSALESRLAHASRVNTLGEMASGLVHELTQPLTAILAQVQAARRMLKSGAVDQLLPVFDDTVAQAHRASALLERFRNWSRPQKAPATVFDLRDTLKNVQSLLGPQAEGKGGFLSFQVPDQAVNVLGDPVEMEQVVFNLVRNAIESSNDKGGSYIAVELQQEAGRIVLDVSDNGPGVAEDIRERLFTPFTTTRAGGTGLGLALSQRLVERAGGDIALVSGSPGQTVFRVTLPSGDGTPETSL